MRKLLLFTVAFVLVLPCLAGCGDSAATPADQEAAKNAAKPRDPATVPAPGPKGAVQPPPP